MVASESGKPEIKKPHRWSKLKQRVKQRWDRSADLRLVLSWIKRTAPRLAWLLIRLAAALALLYLAREVNRDELTTEQALVAAGLILGSLAALSMTPRLGGGFARRLSKFSLGPVGLELLTDAQQAADRSPAEDEKEMEAVSMQALRLRFERKLSYIANDLLGDGSVPRFVTIGSLRYDGYISETEERTLARIMVLRNADLAELPAEERKEFLDAANRVVGNIRASVLHGLVRNLVKNLDGFVITEIARVQRNDLLLEHGSKRFRIAPAFAESNGSKILKNAKERLAEDTKSQDILGVIVLPPASKAKSSPDSDPAVVKSAELVGFLKGRAKEQVAG